MTNTNTWVVKMKHDWAFIQTPGPVLPADRFYRFPAEWRPNWVGETEFARVCRLPHGCSLPEQKQKCQ
jgi:hypothetical protein